VTSDLRKIPCVHGYILMQDSCPGCDAAREIQHKPDVRPMLGFKGRMVRRCIVCGQQASDAAHKPEKKIRKARRAKNTNRQGANFELKIMEDLTAYGYDCLRSSGSRGAVDVVAVSEMGALDSAPGLLFIQAKISKPVIPPAERVALMGLALRAGALPLVAYRLPGSVGYRELTGPGPKEWRLWLPTNEGNENHG